MSPAAGGAHSPSHLRPKGSDPRRGSDPRFLPHSTSRPLHRWRGATAIALAALLLAPTAFAHVTLSPAFVEAGVGSTIHFDTPNEREGRVTISLRLAAPTGVELATAAAPPGWELTLDDGVATWTGGRIEGTDVVSFPLEVTARTEPGNQTFRAVQRYDDGESVNWEASLTVVPATGDDAPSQQLGRAVAAGAVGLGVIAISLIVLWRVRQRPLQEK